MNKGLCEKNLTAAGDRGGRNLTSEYLGIRYSISHSEPGPDSGAEKAF
jgi:hypothetical protein